MNENKISVVIRTYNEKKHIKEVLDSLSNQTHRNYEIIIVDSGSNDGSLEIMNGYQIKLISIKKEDFNYSYASNVGVKNSTGNIVCFLSGHSVPVSRDYLEKTNKMFENSRIGACYGEVEALPDGSFTEKVFNKLGYIKSKFKGKQQGTILENRIHPGIFSCSNASARKELLIKFPFQEELGQGGEDIEVAYQIIKAGYVVARVPELLVMHSHGKKLFEFMKEYKSWQNMYKDVLKYIKKNDKI